MAVVEGYSTYKYEDMYVSLDVQPLSKDDIKMLPEGEHITKRMCAYSDFLLRASDQGKGTRGDWLYYRGGYDPEGHWYECISSVGWDHTMIQHCKSQFVQVSDPEAQRLPLPECSGGMI